MKRFEVGLREAMRAMREGNETERREIEKGVDRWSGGPTGSGSRSYSKV